MIIIKS